MIHGGEIYSKKSIQYDFSVNINPLGVPGQVKEELSAAISGEAGAESCLERYPDQDCTELRKALSAFTGVPADRILCGNGASELIEAAVRAIRPGSILLTAPSFSGYRHAAEGAGVRIRYHALRREEDFRLTERYLEDLERQAAEPEGVPKRKQSVETSPDEMNPEGLPHPPEMAILCNPANPVGNTIEPRLLERIVETCARQGTWLLADECFLGFLKDEGARTARRYFFEKSSISGRLLVLDAFTKRFAMPGVRLGYLMAEDPEILKKIYAQQPEWSVSVLAQTAGLAALKTGARGMRIMSGTHGFLDRTRALVASERAKMEQALKQMGFRVFPGEANYIFFSSADPSDFPVQRGTADSAWRTGGCTTDPPEQGETDLQEALLEKGILIRSCENYVGLRRGDYRIAVLSPDKNAVLLEAMREIRGV